jgi:hypothetical protein
VNKAAFEALPLEEQAKMIALREVADTQAAQLAFSKDLADLQALQAVQAVQAVPAAPES